MVSALRANGGLLNGEALFAPFSKRSLRHHSIILFPLIGRLSVGGDFLSISLTTPILSG